MNNFYFESLIYHKYLRIVKKQKKDSSKLESWRGEFGLVWFEKYNVRGAVLNLSE